MRWLNLIVIALVSTSLYAADEKTRTFRFSKDDLDKVPAGWKADKTGTGGRKRLEGRGRSDRTFEDGFVLAQTAPGPAKLFNLCVADNTSYKDVEASVAFKAMKGDKDQGGGIVWRYQDANNYYVARMNPLEDNFRVYVVTRRQAHAIGDQRRDQGTGQRMAHDEDHAGRQPDRVLARRQEASGSKERYHRETG